MLQSLLTVLGAAGLATAVVRTARKDPRALLPRAWELPLITLAVVLAVGGGLMVDTGWNATLVVVLTAFGVVLGAVDLRTKLLPNPLLLRFGASIALLLLVAAAVTGPGSALIGAVVGAAALFTVYLLLALISPAGMGMGDVKLAAILGMIGGWAGASAWVGTLLGGFVAGALAGGIVLLRRGSRSSTFPFGPGMLLAALASLLLSS